MYNRYREIKKLFKDYIILIKNKSNYKTFDIDKSIIEYQKIKNIKDLENYSISYLILDNLDIIVNKKYDNNRYLEFKFKTIIQSAIEKIKEGSDEDEKI